MDPSRRHEALFVRRRCYRWALAAAYLSMMVILAVTLSGVIFDGSGLTTLTAYRSGR